MTHKEFEDLTGRPICPEEYTKVELVYMAASQKFDKQMFCEAFNGTSPKTQALFFDLAKTITEQEQAMKRMEEQNRKEWEEQANKDQTIARTLLQKAAWFMENGHDEEGWECEEMAHNLIGRAGAIKLKIWSDIMLTQEDRDYIDKHLK